MSLYQGTRSRPLHDSLVMTVRSMRHSLREIDVLMIGIMMPVMLMLLMTVVFGGAMDVGTADYVDYVVPGVLLLCAGYGASLTAVSVTQDMTGGIVNRFRTMNVFPAAILFGHVSASLMRNIVSTALVIATALLIGFRPSAGPVEWLAIVGLMLLFIVALSWMSAVVGLIANHVETASAFGFFFVFLPYLSGAFVPVHTLPSWLQPIAEHQPITPIGETLRGLLFRTSIEQYGWIAVTWCGGILLVSAVVGAVLWRNRSG